MSDTSGKAGIRAEKPFLVWGVKELKLAVFGSFTAVMFGLMILVASLLAVVNPLSVYPQSPETIITPIPSQVAYYLAYPGILPDSPLYKLKAMRDAVVLFFTNGDQKKASKELLYADKRIRAAQELVDGGKVTLGVSTASKAEKYLESAVNRIEKSSSQGVDEKSMLLKLVDATAKHDEVLEGIQTKTDGNEQKVIMEWASKTKALHDSVEQTLREAK